MVQKAELRAARAEVNALAREATERAKRIVKLLEQQEKVEVATASVAEENPQKP